LTSREVKRQLSQKTLGWSNFFQGYKLTAQTSFITKPTPFMIIKQKAFIQIYDKTPSLTYNTLNLVVIDY